jgi:adenosine/AMP kinase
MADTGAPSQLTLDLVSVQKPDDMNFIFGTSHFIKTVEDVYEALTTSSPSIEFGLAVRAALLSPGSLQRCACV